MKMPAPIAKCLATFFYSGYFPVAPGTFGSFVAAVLAVYLSKNIFVYLAVLAAITLLGIVSSGEMEKMLGKKDPGCVVIDEAAGIMISFFLLPNDFKVLITAFFLFRAFDMFKIYPENKLEAMGGGFGIMMDDVVAGIYTNIVMHMALRLI